LNLKKLRLRTMRSSSHPRAGIWLRRLDHEGFTLAARVRKGMLTPLARRAGLIK
jgi:hypothetical protein